MSSAAAQSPLPGKAVHCAARVGIEMLTRVLAAEQQAPGFRAIAVRPGVTDTDMQAHASAAAGRHARRRTYSYREL